MTNALLRRSLVSTGVAAATAGALVALSGTASADQQVPPGSLGTITAVTPSTGVAASAPTVTSSGPCDGKNADGTANPDQDTVIVRLFSPSLQANRPNGQVVQASTASYSRTGAMSVPFSRTFTDSYQQAGATIAPNERIRIEMQCSDAFSTPGGTFEGSVLFNADASRYTFDAPAAVTPPPPLPEVPLAALLPIAGLVGAGTIVVRRRRTGAAV